MAKDKNGNVLKVGDTVVLTATVILADGDDQKCPNLAVQVCGGNDDDFRPTVTCNSKLVEISDVEKTRQRQAVAEAARQGFNS